MVSPTFKMKPIDKFEGDFLFLSNFYPGKVYLWREVFHTAEHAYQYAKARTYLPPVVLAHIMSIENPGKFKRRMKAELIRPEYKFYPVGQQEWDSIKVAVMKEILEKKFSNILLHDRLMDTAPRELIEGNTWNDAFWGVPVDKHGNRTKPGKNMLGKLLMGIRDAG